MRYWMALALVATIPLGAGCTSAGRNTETGALLGAAIGAGAGAIIGHQSGDRGPGALIGAGLGALTGGLIGNAIDRSEDEAAAAQADAEVALHEAQQMHGAVSILDVIRMSQSGVSDRLIIAKIDQSRSAFDISPQDIIDLRRSSVSDPVIEHMLSRSRTQPEVTYVRPTVRRIYVQRPYRRWRPPVRMHLGYSYYR